MSRLQGDLKERTLSFAARVLEAVGTMPNEPRGWVVGKQLARSGTSIGANVWEADHAHTDTDFAYKISLARKESSETQYWLTLARRAHLLRAEVADPLSAEAEELMRILAAMVIKTQRNLDPKEDR